MAEFDSNHAAVLFGAGTRWIVFGCETLVLDANDPLGHAMTKMIYDMVLTEERIVRGMTALRDDMTRALAKWESGLAWARHGEAQMAADLDRLIATNAAQIDAFNAVWFAAQQSCEVVA